MKLEIITYDDKGNIIGKVTANGRLLDNKFLIIDFPPNDRSDAPQTSLIQTSRIGTFTPLPDGTIDAIRRV